MEKNRVDKKTQRNLAHNYTSKFMIRLGKGKDHTILRDVRENEMYWKRTLNYRMGTRQVATVVSRIFVFTL